MRADQNKKQDWSKPGAVKPVYRNYEEKEDWSKVGAVKPIYTTKNTPS